MSVPEEEHLSAIFEEEEEEELEDDGMLPVDEENDDDDDVAYGEEEDADIAPPAKRAKNKFKTAVVAKVVDELYQPEDAAMEARVNRFFARRRLRSSRPKPDEAILDFVDVTDVL